MGNILNNFDDREPLFVNGKCHPISEYQKNECDSINSYIATLKEQKKPIYTQEKSSSDQTTDKVYSYDEHLDSDNSQNAWRHFGELPE